MMCADLDACITETAAAGMQSACVVQEREPL
jgi:hypothetical protein